MDKLSAVIITYNEERNVDRCIHSLQGVVDEILAIDSLSTDRTKSICTKLGVRFYEQPWLGYSEQKNQGNALAKFDYVLSIDADEALSDELKKSILELKQKGFSGAYRFNRLTNYCGQWIHHSGWYPDAKVRIFNRNQVKWTGAIHETLTLENTQVQPLKGDLLHYSYYTEAEHYRQIEKFTNIAAQDYFEKNKKVPTIKLWLSPAAKFIRDYVIKRGFLDGKAGLKICLLSAKTTYLKYYKLKQLLKKA